MHGLYFRHYGIFGSVYGILYAHNRCNTKTVLKSKRNLYEVTAHNAFIARIVKGTVDAVRSIKKIHLAKHTDHPFPIAALGKQTAFIICSNEPS